MSPLERQVARRLVAPAASRSPWQLLYRMIHLWRRRRSARHARRLPRPVISIGNLHLGGTGKTPLTAAVAAHLLARGLQVAILSRGYRRKDPTSIRVVSQGQGPLLGPSLAGDEPVMLAGLVPGAAVVIGADRFKAGRHALMRLDRTPDLFVLDDGFAHLRLARDLDILTFPQTDPFGGGRLLPSGRLREPLEAVRAAHAAVLTGASDHTAGDALAAALRPYGFGGQSFLSHTRTEAIRRCDGRRVAVGSKVLLVSAIARPEPFELAARAAGVQIAGQLRFRDHHAYPQASLEKIRQHARSRGAGLVLVTAKDRVKLQGRLDLPLAELPVRAEPEPTFFTWLDQRLATLREAAAPRSDWAP